MNHLPEGSFKDSPFNKECLNVPELRKAILLTGIDSNVTRCTKNNTQALCHATAAVCFLGDTGLTHPQTLASR